MDCKNVLMTKHINIFPHGPKPQYAEKNKSEQNHPFLYWFEPFFSVYKFNEPVSILLFRRMIKSSQPFLIINKIFNFLN